MTKGDELRTMICPYCKHRIQTNAPDPVYCGPHRASMGPASYPRIQMVRAHGVEMTHASDMIDQEAFAGLLAECNQAHAEIDRLRAAVQEMTTRAGTGYDREDSVEWLESIVRIGKAALGSEQQPKMCQHGIDTNRWHCQSCAEYQERQR